MACPWSGIVLADAPVEQVGTPLLIAVAALTGVTGLAWLYARRAFPAAAERAAFTLTVLWPNTGSLGIPIALAALGPDMVPTAVLYSALVVAPLSWVLGGSMAAHLGDNERGLRLRGILRNHGLLPIALGLAWALASLPAPATLSSFAQVGLVLLSFVAFLAAGLTLARARVRLDRDVGVAVALRVGVSPSLLLAATPLVPIPRAFVLQAAMASGLSTFNLARVHGLPIDRIAGAFAWSTGAVLVAATCWLALS